MNLPYYNDDQVDLAAADDAGDGGSDDDDDDHDGHRDYASVVNYFDSWFYTVVFRSMPLSVTSASSRELCFAAFDVKG